MMNAKKKPTEKKADDEKKYENLYKRALADYQNLLKQTVKEKEDLARYANQALIEEVIPVYENLKMALEHAKNCEGQKNGIEQGVEYVLRQLWGILESNGVSKIETEKKDYDHHLMEAVDTADTEVESLEGTVAKELKAGYVLKGRLLVPARVAVYKLNRKTEAG